MNWFGSVMAIVLMLCVLALTYMNREQRKEIEDCRQRLNGCQENHAKLKSQKDRLNVALHNTSDELEVVRERGNVIYNVYFIFETIATCDNGCRSLDEGNAVYALVDVIDNKGVNHVFVNADGIFSLVRGNDGQYWLRVQFTPLDIEAYHGRQIDVLKNIARINSRYASLFKEAGIRVRSSSVVNRVALYVNGLETIVLHDLDLDTGNHRTTKSGARHLRESLSAIGRSYTEALRQKR